MRNDIYNYYATNYRSLVDRPLRRSVQGSVLYSTLFVLRRDKACLVSTYSPLAIHLSRL
jgi:hypothetical protein